MLVSVSGCHPQCATRDRTKINLKPGHVPVQCVLCHYQHPQCSHVPPTWTYLHRQPQCSNVPPYQLTYITCKSDQIIISNLAIHAPPPPPPHEPTFFIIPSVAMSPHGDHATHERLIVLCHSSACADKWCTLLHLASHVWQQKKSRKDSTAVFGSDVPHSSRTSKNKTKQKHRQGWVVLPFLTCPGKCWNIAKTGYCCLLWLQWLYPGQH